MFYNIYLLNKALHHFGLLFLILRHKLKLSVPFW